MELGKVKAEMLSTPENYLTFEREADTRHEFLDGEIYDRVEFDTFLKTWKVILKKFNDYIFTRN